MALVHGSAGVFARVVDLMAKHLDASELTTEELADRAFMSRSHFDRVVKAAAGETSAGFRRRLRLERAAYSLLSQRRTILVVAERG